MMTSVPARPRLLFFQYRYDRRLPAFLLAHTREHVKCLAQFFDVTVIHEDGDYDALCDRYQPAVALFEGGVNHVSCRRPTITNTGRHPGIPKLGFHNGDGFCNARAGFISDMERWGIETFFTISTTTAEHTPEIARALFVWPNCVDPELYHDYGEWKSIPVLLIGNTGALYPWRRHVAPLLAERVPSLICPHPGYEADATLVDVLHGERYARTLNASAIVPTCGTLAREIVRKHFEIPACGACLVTERSPALEAAGFVDMENCVFADSHDAVGKVLGLLRRPEALAAITRAGHDLVHARHTLRQRSQILQWLLLRSTLRAHERIVQPDPFAPLAVAPAAAGVPPPLRGDGPHLALLRDGDRHFEHARYGEARRLYVACTNHMPWMPEPRLRAALCSLCQGDARSAQALIDALLEFTLGHYRALDPDPVEWAYFIVAAVCLGRLDEARARAREFPWLRHPELDRARWLSTVAGGERPPRPTEPASADRRRTIHHLPERAFEDWVARIGTMLRACGRGAVADAVQAAAHATPERPDDVSAPARARTSADSRRRFRRRVTSRALLGRARRLAATLARRLGARRLAGAWRAEPLARAIAALGREGRLASVLILGAGHERRSMRAFAAATPAGGPRPALFCIGQASSAESVAHAVRTMQAQRTDGFDAVVIDSEALGCTPEIELLRDTLRRARYVVLDGIEDGNHQNFQRLLADPDYRLVAADPEARPGYGVFRRSRGVPTS